MAERENTYSTYTSYRNTSFQSCPTTRGSLQFLRLLAVKISP